MPKMLSILIPTMNEIAGIERTIKRIRIDELRNKGHDVEILVVDGGSTDGTIEAARRLGANVIVESRPGYGRAYKTAFLHARGDILVTLDGDDTYPSELILKMVKFVRKSNFITTNRFSHSNPIAMNRINIVGNSILSFATRILFNIRLFDSQSGMWIFRKDVLKSIMPFSDGMSFSEEIKIRAFLSLKGVKEVPVPYKRRMGSPKLKIFKDGFRNFLHLLRLFGMLKLVQK